MFYFTTLYKCFDKQVVYVTATLPYVLLFIFIVKGLTMDGAIDGIKFYVVPKWHHLLRFQVNYFYLDLNFAFFCFTISEEQLLTWLGYIIYVLYIFMKYL